MQQSKLNSIGHFASTGRAGRVASAPPVPTLCEKGGLEVYGPNCSNQLLQEATSAEMLGTGGQARPVTKEPNLCHMSIACLCSTCTVSAKNTCAHVEHVT